MTRHASVLLIALVLGCTHGRAVPVRMTADGGALRLERGASSRPESEPVRDALGRMQAHCGPAFEVTALELVPVSYASDITTTQITYLCRKPVSTSLNDTLQASVKRDDDTAMRKQAAAVAAVKSRAPLACQVQRDCDLGVCIDGFCRR